MAPSELISPGAPSLQQVLEEEDSLLLPASEACDLHREVNKSGRGCDVPLNTSCCRWPVCGPPVCGRWLASSDAMTELPRAVVHPDNASLVIERVLAAWSFELPASCACCWWGLVVHRLVVTLYRALYSRSGKADPCTALTGPSETASRCHSDSRRRDLSLRAMFL